MSTTSISNSGDGPLYLSIEAGVSEYHACIVDERLEVIWVEHVTIDAELPEYGTRDGVFTLGDGVTVPSELRLAALDLLFEKLARNTREDGLLRRVVAVSGAAQPHALHFLLPQFWHLLASLDQQPVHRFSQILTASLGFALAIPTSSADSSATAQVGQLEQHFGRLAQGSSFGEVPGSHKELKGNAQQSHVRVMEAGRRYFAEKTGSKPLSWYSAAQLVKLRQKDELEIERGEIEVGAGVFGRTARIVLEGTLFSSLMLGCPAPIDASDACSTNLFNPEEQDWQDDILDFVMGDIDLRDDHKREKGGSRLRKMLGQLGTISSYMVERYGFSADCLVASFTSAPAAAFLSFPLQHLASSKAHSEQDALVHLSGEGTDLLLMPASAYIPHPNRQLFSNPAQSTGNAQEKEARYVVMLTSQSAGLARALARDLYCNGSWDVFSRLSAMVPHGGTLGLDNKYFTLFFPHGDASFARGFLRFVDGGRVADFPDRKCNPRLILESQFLSLRTRLSQAYAALGRSESSASSSTTAQLASVSPYDPLGFPKLSSAFLPTRIVLTGGASVNPAMSSILSTVFNAPTYLLAASKQQWNDVEEDDSDGLDAGKPKMSVKRTSAVLGSAYKAAWVFASVKGQKQPFNNFLKSKLEMHSDAVGLQPPIKYPDECFEDYPISSVSHFVPRRSLHARTSSMHTIGSSTHYSFSRNSSISGYYSSTTSAFTPPPSAASPPMIHKSSQALSASSVMKPKQHMYNPDDDLPLPPAVLNSDLPGLNLIAIPDEHEFKYYSSMMPEYVRLEQHALRGHI
ncbi:xylulokinase [Sporobolomyces koalae]|uniref:xylulokinase n=1 Tax=Sporobolomyces koalae TaxID=500713 RepID=UPI0031764518